MEGWKGEKESKLENVVSAQEKSFLELLCEADPSIEEAWEGFSAYRPESLGISLTQWAPPTEMVLPGGASSNFTFCEERVNASGAGKIKLKRKRARKICQQCKLLMGCNCNETRPNKKPKKDGSWFYVNMKKDKLEGRLAELHDLVKGPRTNKEAAESIVSLLDELKVLSSFYFQYSGTSRHLGGEESWIDGLRSRGLCLVPTSAVAHSPLVHKRWTKL